MLDRGGKQAIKREDGRQYPNRRWTMVESQQTDNAPLIYERKRKPTSDRRETSEMKVGKGDFRREEQSLGMCCLAVLHLCFDAI